MRAVREAKAVDAPGEIKVSRACVGEEERAAVAAALGEGYFGLGPRVAEFEAALAARLGVEHVVATSSGTAALHLALEALDLAAGDEVIVPSLTFVGCFQAIVAAGAVPVACDVDPETLCADVADVRRRIGPRTRAIMPVDYAGAPCDLDALLAVAAERGLRVVEDAAHAFGSRRGARPVGGAGDLVCFSFDSIKNVTCGEGGAVVCRDAAAAERVRRQRVLGVDRGAQAGARWQERRWEFAVRERGFRYHMSNLNAAIGLAQLAKLERFVARRRALCRRYDRALAGVPGLRPLALDRDGIAPHIYVVRVAGGRRDALMAHLRAHGIETGINYVPNHRHPLFCRPGVRLPVTERAAAEILTLPLHCGLADADVDRVAERVGAFLAR
ncbi:MAG TPA: DegT/DnrJ/EryC1/StrS family aminotransferase [Candidatus Binatia bacterium]|nr:DegT/DnrJ/EryC1/StrS family aminotransferase [Candidatus Binatia bacterium]